MAALERNPLGIRLRAFDFSRAICRVVSASAPDKLATGIASAKTVAAVVSLSRADRRHAATVEQWDSQPWLLNTPDGIVDLQTGRMAAHDRYLYLTKMAAVAPGGNCPLWLNVLANLTNKNVELQSFLQRVAGYSLTGNTREHALFFCYGTGGNGKGVFLNTLTAIMGDYAAIAPMETFVATQNDRHPTDLAGLRGSRLVTSQETEQGRRWAESKIKALTGGDPITARFMRQDFFTYIPQFKLVIAGNHKPGLRGVDEAIRRRFNLLPFVAKFTKPDKELPAKLRAEWPGILQWAIDGCLEWQRIGLKPPEIVQEATAFYFAQEDLIEQWLEEHFPDRKDKVLNRIRDLRGGKLYDAQWRVRGRGEGIFAEQIASIFDVTCRKLHLNERNYELTSEHFRRPTPQQSLW